MAQQDAELRRALALRLRWRFSFSSGDPREARCLAEHPADAARVADLVVRRLRRSRRGKRVAFLADAAVCGSPASPGGLEALLRAELHGNRSRGAVGAGCAREQPLEPLEALEALYGDVPTYSEADGAEQAQRGLLESAATPSSAHLSTLRGVVRGEDDDELLAVFEYEGHTLQDLLKYNRHWLDGAAEASKDGPERALADCKMRFVLFQLRDALRALHERGIACDGFTPSDILVTDALWVKLGSLPLVDRSETPVEREVAPSLSLYHDVEARSARSITERWCDGDVSNFEYLMALNSAAGRRMVDSVFHPFLPWVSDFSAPMSGWRDLAKSKFRLNKGDHQLDRTFESSLIPHHITESLSEITYYIYMARRTPMAVLRKVVRSNFEAKEYPSTLARMFEWTPDECIPELFTDATVFESLHGDGVMDDLALPSWCASPAEFLRAHREMLESHQVSSRLHLWIDLNFGVALSGEEAIRQKNVPLKVQSATHQHIGKSAGFVQLFHTPHPRKRGLEKHTFAQTSSVRGSYLQEADDKNLGTPSSRPVMLSSSSRQGSYHRNEIRRQVARMLNRATQLVSEAQSEGGISPVSHAPSEEPMRFRRVNSLSSNLMGAGGGASSTNSFTGAGGGSGAAGASSSGDSKGQLMIRNFTQRKRGKTRTKSGDAPPSPTSLARADRSGNNMSRLATVIPNFFHADGTNGSSGANGSGSGNSGSGEMPPSLKLAIPDASSQNTVMGSSPSTSLSPSSSSGSELSMPPPRLLTISTPRGFGHHGGSASGGSSGGSHHTRHASLGGTSPYQNSGGSHLLRDLWQQLSKPEDDGASNTVNSGDLIDIAGFSQSFDTSMDWADLDSNDLIDEMDMQLLQLSIPVLLPDGNAFQSKPAGSDEKRLPNKQSPSSARSSVLSAQDPTGEDWLDKIDIDDKMPLDQFSLGTPDTDVIIEPCYHFSPPLLEECLPEVRNMSPFDCARAADYFALGCIMAEIYSREPLFSQRSAIEYLLTYADSLKPSASSTSNNEGDWITEVAESMLSSGCRSSSPPWNACVVRRLDGIPLAVKQAVLALVHPHPIERLRLVGVLDGEDVFTTINSFKTPIPGFDDYSSPTTPLFPATFRLVDRYFEQINSSRDWSHQFTATRRFLMALTPSTTEPPHRFGVPAPAAALSNLQWGILEPVLRRFFTLSPTSSVLTSNVHGGTEVIGKNAGAEHGGIERVVAAIVFLLPYLLRNGVISPSHLGPSIVRLDDVIRVYESPELGFVLKICLSSPEVLRSLIEAFGEAAFIDQIFPAVVEWVAAGSAISDNGSPGSNSSSSPRQSQALFASEACSLAAVSCGELASPLMLGSSLATKYALPKLLQVFGKVKAKWNKLAGSSTVRRRDTTASPSTDGESMHMTMLSKVILYEQHHVADALLQLCREIGDFSVVNNLLPHLLDVLPRLVLLSESIGAVRIEGVPEELGREIYVIFRVLRHVVRTLGDSSEAGASSTSSQSQSMSVATSALHREFLQRKPTSLVDLLAKIQPPFLHPRLTSALVAAASSSSTAESVDSSEPSGTRSNSKKKAVLRYISGLKEAASRQELRAFTVVGLARTLVALCQRMGTDATLAEPTLLETINKFLTRCAEVYVDLEVSNFQWHVASELVTEFCVPLRQLLGRELFDKHLPVVASSSVLQLLLLPLGESSSKASVGKSKTRTFMSPADMRITHPKRVAPTLPKRDRPFGSDDQLESPSIPSIETAMPNELDDLLRFAYRSTKLHGVRATSFLHVPRLAQRQEDVSDALFAIQEEKRLRRAAGARTGPSSAAAARNSELAWLRPAVSQPFMSKVESEEASQELRSPQPRSNHHAQHQQFSTLAGLGGAWAINAEIRDVLHAHSSSVRAISVDAREQLLLSGSKNGSCRVWRISSRPSSAVGAIYTDGAVMSVASMNDGYRALAIEASYVHVWNLATSQVRAKLPFKSPGESVASVTLLGTPGVALLWSSAASMGSPCPSWSSNSAGDFAVATARRVVGVDLRAPKSSPRIVAEWHVDANLGGYPQSPAISAIASVVDLSTGVSYLVVGALNGFVTILDPRTGRQIGKWQALDSGGGGGGIHGASGSTPSGGGGGGSSSAASGGGSSGARIVKMLQISPSLLLVVGSEREARLWQLQIQSHAKPLLRQVISGLPENVSETQVTVQPATGDDSRSSGVLVVASSAKILTARLVGTARERAAPVMARVDVWQVTESPASASAATASQSSSSTKMVKSKFVARSIATLPMRQLLVVGADDGSLKCLV